MAEPLIKLEPQGTAPVISYNVPERTAQTGRNYIVWTGAQDQPLHLCGPGNQWKHANARGTTKASPDITTFSNIHAA